MKKFILLFHESPEMYRGLSPEEIQGIIEKYTSWRDRLERDGRYIEGRKLNGDGRVVRKADGGIAVTDGPYIEGKELLGGFMIIHATSYEEAIALAQEGPAVMNGAVEIRHFDLE